MLTDISRVGLLCSKPLEAWGTFPCSRRCRSRIGEIKMQRHSFLAAGLGFALAIAVLVVGLKSFSYARMVGKQSGAVQSIDRTLKGDRSTLMPARTSTRSAISSQRDTVIVPELLDGCEPVRQLYRRLSASAGGGKLSVLRTPVQAGS